MIPIGYAFADFPEAVRIVTQRSGIVHDILGDNCTRYPGREIDVNASPQFVGGTYMQAEEYDKLIDDPMGFIGEIVLPRTCSNLKNPKMAMATWAKMGSEAEKIASFQRGVKEDFQALGYPSIPAATVMSPLDIIGDGLRDLTKVLLDIRRIPEKVKMACEALVEPIIKVGLAFKPLGIEFVFIPLHLNEYLSPELYKEFYWPYLKKVIYGFADEGIKSMVFFEGSHDAHLETILELPAGWGIAQFDKTDVRKVKKLLQGHTCIMGGVPISLIISGTPERIDEYIKNLLEEMKPGGGYILATNVSIAPQETPIENIHAFVNAVEKYGMY